MGQLAVTKVCVNVLLCDDKYWFMCSIMCVIVCVLPLVSVCVRVLMLIQVPCIT